MLRGLRPDHGARQRTLRGAIDWSWDLLEPWEQLALATFSVFRGGFTLEAAEAVVDLSAWSYAPPVIDVVHSLVEQSLVRAEEPLPGCARFHMYVSIQDYAHEKMTDAAEYIHIAKKDNEAEKDKKRRSDEKTKHTQNGEVEHQQ